MTLLTLQIGPNGVSEHSQTLVEAANCLALGFGRQAGIPRWWWIVLPILEQLDCPTHKAATILLQHPYLQSITNAILPDNSAKD